MTSKNKLHLNSQKSNYIIFRKPGSTCRMLPPLILDNKPIIIVQSVKFLGLSIDQFLQWDVHINSVNRKIAPLTGILHRLQHVLSDAAKRAIYFGLIHSNLTCMNIVWGTATKSRLWPLEVFQKRCLKILFRYPASTPSKILFNKLSALSLSQQYILSSAVTMYQLTKGLKRSNVNFHIRSNISGHSTRNPHLLHLPKCKSSKYGTGGVSHGIIIFFNLIPTFLHDVNNTSLFKKKIKSYFFYRSIDVMLH